MLYKILLVAMWQSPTLKPTSLHKHCSVVCLEIPTLLVVDIKAAAVRLCIPGVVAEYARRLTTPALFIFRQVCSIRIGTTSYTEINQLRDRVMVYPHDVLGSPVHRTPR